ncbi:MAG TPA: hypothetical protein VKE22_08820 [Haliangiales bacterium]|nr:hypothetical protein [Haliangiales bacterium]
MSFVGRWTWGKKARLVAEVLRAAGADGTVAVVERPALARLLGEGRSVRPIGPAERAAFAPDADVGAIVGEPQGDGELDRWVEAVRAGGAVVQVGREPREEATRRALCAGLVDIEQRVAGRWVVTIGRRP